MLARRSHRCILRNYGYVRQGSGSVAAEIACNKAITAHAKRKSWRKAISVMLEMDQKSLRCDAVACSAVISVLSRVSKWHQAGSMLTLLDNAGVEPDIVVYNAVVHALAVGRQWNQALSTVEEMARNGVQPDAITLSTVIGVCGKERKWWQALQLLTAMENLGISPNVVSYNIVINACGKSLHWNIAVRLFESMLIQSTSPTAATYSALISACSISKHWDTGLSLFYEMQTHLIPPSNIVCSAALQACSSGRLWSDALSLFARSCEEGIQPDVISYNAVINAARLGQQWRPAVQMFDDMQTNSVRPSASSVRVLMMTCEESQQWSVCLSLLKYWQYQSMPADGVIFGSAINASGKGYKWEVSLQLVEEMKGVQLCVDAGNLSTVVSAMAQANEGPRAIALLGDMHEERIHPLQSAINFAVTAYLRQSTPKDAHDFIRKAKCWQGETGLSIYNALIGECGRTHAKDTVMDLLLEMHWKRITPSATTYGAAMGVCGKAHEWKMALELFRTMNDVGPSGLSRVDHLAHTAVVTACARAAAWRHAVALISPGADSEWMLNQQISPSACVAAVLACDRVGLWECAILVFLHMKTLQLCPQTHALNAAVSACRRSSAWEAALALWHFPLSKPLRDSTTAGLLLQACERAGRWQMALSWFYEVRQACMELGTLAYNAAIFASSFGRDWCRAVNLLKLMSASSTPMTRSTKNAVLRACEGPERLVEATVALTLLQSGVGASRSQKWRDQKLSSHLEITEMSLEHDAARIDSRISAPCANGAKAGVAGEFLDGQVVKIPLQFRVPAQSFEFLLNNLQQIDHDKITTACQAVQSEVFATFGHGAAYAHMVGSQLYGVALNVSDVDILIELSPEVVSALSEPSDVPNFEKVNERLIAARAVMQFRRHLDSDSCLAHWGQCDVALDAKRPIVSATYLPTPTPVAVEVSFDQSLAALRKSALLATCANYDHRILQLAKLVRFWAGMRGIVGQRKGYLSGFAWCLMATFYLQCRKMMRPLIAARRHDHSAFKHLPGSSSGDFFGSFQGEDQTTNQNTHLELDSVALVPGFFAFYAHSFQWELEVISVRLGQRALRRNSSPSLLSIEDPVEIDVDLATPYLNFRRDLRLRAEIRRSARYLCKENADEQAWGTVFRRRTPLASLPHALS